MDDGASTASACSDHDSIDLFDDNDMEEYPDLFGVEEGNTELRSKPLSNATETDDEKLTTNGIQLEDDALKTGKSSSSSVDCEKQSNDDLASAEEASTMSDESLFSEDDNDIEFDLGDDAKTNSNNNKADDSEKLASSSSATKSAVLSFGAPAQLEVKASGEKKGIKQKASTEGRKKNKKVVSSVLLIWY